MNHTGRARDCETIKGVDTRHARRAWARREASSGLQGCESSRSGLAAVYHHNGVPGYTMFKAGHSEDGAHWPA